MKGGPSGGQAAAEHGHFDAGLLGRTCVLELGNGRWITLPTRRWVADPGGGDELLLVRCAGSTLDIGCGPGRLTAALARRGALCVGIDVSPTAIELTRQRGGTAVQCDVFARVPGEGRWRFALLADGNIGIGGDPVALLGRVFQLLAPGGRALVELDPPGRRVRADRVRINGGAWFRWAWLGVDALDEVARAASARVVWTGAHGDRHFAELMRART
ncbi:MAG TPA: class I SAM-dependent methyltransferase [Amycolatopsis sp.]|uniref:class I SAM-dependent methyltransferase n=1 Tax=Amycolatopsis sp. TaxID=37632 RepID=UPI002B475378|nr:class I SAM-dependent methyltransferase [Amycolatopsis sp.]HKS44161.1 class I SAM-dependent methyltransferase [Amycolatopsis sp.]